MTADEIRKTEITGEWTEAQEAIGDSVFQMLREIAAQLAELNERLKPGNLDVNIYDCSFADSRRAGEAKQ
jgi:hypothetical protein